MGTPPPERASADVRARRRAVLALCLLVPAPSLGIACEMLWFPGAFGLAAHGATKLWILGFPLFWTARVERASLALPPRSTRGLVPGFLLGAVGAVAVALAFHFVLRELIDPAVVREMARENHLLTPAAYLGVAVYTCAINSLLEEYVWRWFVHRQCARLVPRGAAIALAAAGFTLHHTLILFTQFDAVIGVVGSVAVFSAACAWSWLYARTTSIWSAWLSHAIIDVAVFWAGWQLLFVG